MQEVVYKPESQMRNPGRVAAGMIGDLWNSRELAWRLTLRNIKALYRQSLLGYFWAFLPAIVMTATMVYLRGSGVFSVGDTDIPYPAFVLIGTILWQTFSEATVGTIRTVVQARPMLAKINFPREALFLAAIGETIFNFLVKLIMLLAVCAWYGLVPAAEAIILAPLGVAGIILCGSALGLFLTPIGTLYKDVAQGLAILMGLWMLLTPVLYPMNNAQGKRALVMEYNPMTYMVSATRDWFTVGATHYLTGFVIVTACAAVLFVISWFIYRLTMPIIIERMGG